MSITPARTGIDPDHFLRRLLQDALSEATAGYWLNRAEWFDTCNPVIAQACRNKATYIARYGDERTPTDIAAALPSPDSQTAAT